MIDMSRPEWCDAPRTLRAMLKKTNTFMALLAALFVSTIFGLESAQAEEKNRLFEIRTYYANEGKLDALKARFRDHTVALFKKHGMTNIGYWVPVDNKDNKLVYILAFPNKEARKKAFQGFVNDPDWKAAYKASTKDGKLVKKIDSEFLRNRFFGDQVGRNYFEEKADSSSPPFLSGESGLAKRELALGHAQA